MKRKLLLVFTMFFLTLSLFAGKNEEVIRTFKNKYPEDNFYFIQGLDYKFDLSTNIRYRGILYSDRLEKLCYPFGLEMALERNSDGSSHLENYESLFLKIEVDKPIEEKMKEIFGEKSLLDNNQPLRLEGYRWILRNKGKKIPFNDKSDASYTVVNIFVDKLENINKEEIKKKTYQLARFLYDEMNILTYLQVYIRDDSFFEDYNLVAYQVYPPFREREDIKKILEKIKVKEKIREQEKIALMKVFYKNIGFNMRYTDIDINFKREPLKEYKNQRIKGQLFLENYIDEGSK